MPNQVNLIKNWNNAVGKIESKLKSNNLPRLNDSFFNGGVCCGLTFLLAEYISLENEEIFYNIFNTISRTENADELTSIFLKNPTFFLDFIYKIHILNEQQNTSSLEHNEETKNQQWARNNIPLPNHHRIGSSPTIAGEDFGEITDFNDLSNLFNKLSESESFEFTIYDDESTLAHSILVYKLGNKYILFDSNIGKKLTFETSEEAQRAVIMSTNLNFTEGTKKYTPFDRLWRQSKILSIVIFPVTIIALLLDPFWPSISDDNLEKKPLTNTLWLSFGKIKSGRRTKDIQDKIGRPVKLSSIHENPEKKSELRVEKTLRQEPDKITPPPHPAPSLGFS